MTQVETTGSKRWRLPSLNLKRQWWRANYHTFRLAVLNPARLAMRIGVSAEGDIPEARPVMLVPVHRTAIDIYVISHAVGEFISYVSTDDFGHNRLANALQERLTASFGSIVWHENGISNPRARALELAKDVELRLDQRMIVAAFAQGEYQTNSVDTIEDGLVGLLKWYQDRYLRNTGRELRIPIIPVGLEYDLNGDGLVFSNFGRRLANVVPLLPRWVVPAFGSQVTVRFGAPHYLDDQSPTALTKSVMEDAAALSNIPYRVT